MRLPDSAAPQGPSNDACRRGQCLLPTLQRQLLGSGSPDRSYRGVESFAHSRRSTTGALASYRRIVFDRRRPAGLREDSFAASTSLSVLGSRSERYPRRIGGIEMVRRVAGVLPSSLATGTATVGSAYAAYGQLFYEWSASGVKPRGGIWYYSGKLSRAYGLEPVTWRQRAYAA